MDRRGPRRSGPVRSGPVRHQPDRTNTTSTIYGPCLWTAMPRLQREARYPSRLAVGRAASGLMVGAWSRRRAGDIRAADRTLTGKVQVGPSPLSRRSSIEIVTGGRASASCRPGTSVVKRSSPTRTFSRVLLV
jgi:hypothetical protein